MVRCSAKTLNGTRCKNNRINGFTKCSTHISARGKQVSISARGKRVSSPLITRYIRRSERCNGNTQSGSRCRNKMTNYVLGTCHLHGYQTRELWDFQG